MGWTFHNSIFSAKEMKEEIRRELGNDLIDCGGSGNEFYCLVRHPSTGKSYIVLFLLGCHNKRWGYKDMDETMHPYYYKCPLRILNKADEPISEQAREWRNKARARSK